MVDDELGNPRSAGLPDRRHLRRLERILVPGTPVYFLTACVRNRLPLLAAPYPANALIEAWQHVERQHSWMIGRYVIMPDYVHFFAVPCGETAKTLSGFMGYWKRSTAIRIRRRIPKFTWQAEFFDHVLRSEESYGGKWEYVRLNPIRAGLVDTAEDWPYQGEMEPLTW
jgi:REP element-mobilizing transposase RayT